MGKNPSCSAGNTGSIPGQGTKILYAEGQLKPQATTKIQGSQINNKIKPKNNTSTYIK